MEDYQKRVIEEADALDLKIEKLEDFMEQREWLVIALPEQQRLKRQLDAMRLYSYILHNRIKHFLP